MSARNTIAVMLNKARKERGYSVDELGGLVGRSGKTISAWEVGRGQPDADMLMRLRDIYGLNSIGFFYGEPRALADDLTEQEYELIKNYRHLNTLGKQKTLEYIKDISVNRKNNSYYT
jgi:transcriptional regulator with XRE-family HTH domain